MSSTTHGLATNRMMTTNKSLAPDRYLPACPIKYECRSLFVCLIEMELVNESVEVILQYPERFDEENYDQRSTGRRYFATEAHFSQFISDVKKFAFPYVKTLAESKKSTANASASSSLVQFYSFAFTDAARVRQYGFCRSSQLGNHVLCMVSFLPWYNIFNVILNKIAMIINEKETTSLYHFLEALYEFQLPDPGNHAQIFSHDGLDQIRFQCPDRRIVPSINENRHLLKFFAFFDLDKLIKIFTALLLERRLLIVSRDLENLTSCALSLEQLIYPLEWFHAFVPIMPEHIDLLVFNQPFPFIYGVHTHLYEKINKSQLDEVVILLIDEKQVLNGDKDHLPDNIANSLRKKLRYFQDNGAGSGGGGDLASMYPSGQRDLSASTGRFNAEAMLSTGPLQAFLDAVVMVVDDYREYLLLDTNANEFKLMEEIYFQIKNVQSPTEGSGQNNGGASKKYISNENEFYHEFRITQAFEEFTRDRCDYLKAEYDLISNPNCVNQPQKDFVEALFEQYSFDNSKFQQLLKSSKKRLEILKNKAKDKSIVKKLFTTNNSASLGSLGHSNQLPYYQHGFAPSSSQDYGYNQSTEKSKKAADRVKYKNMTDSAAVAAEDGKKSEINASADFEYNQKLEDDQNSMDSSTSSSSSESENPEKIKEAIRRFAEGTKTSQDAIKSYEKAVNRKTSMDDLAEGMRARYTIDLSNDPDIQKYFASDESDRPMNTVREEPAEIKLIDISEEAAPPSKAAPASDINKDLESLANGLGSLSTQPASSSEQQSGNNLEMLLNIDFSASQVPTSQRNAAQLGALVPSEPSQKAVLPASSTVFNIAKAPLMAQNRLSGVPNSASTPSLNSTVKISAKPIEPNKSVASSSSSDTYHQSIISEFDPISDLNKQQSASSEIKETRPVASKMATASAVNYTNLVPRPFQPPTATQNIFNPMANANKPNYHVNTSMLMSSGQRSATYTGQPSLNTLNNQPMISSYSQHHPFSAQPFYGYNNQLASQVYHPVSFQAGMRAGGQPVDAASKSLSINNQMFQPAQQTAVPNKPTPSSETVKDPFL